MKLFKFLKITTIKYIGAILNFINIIVITLRDKIIQIIIIH